MSKWQNEPQCPDWCVNGAEHLGFQLRTQSSNYWHESAPTLIESPDTDPNLEPQHAEVKLLQRIQTDERGTHVHQPWVSVNGCALTSQGARTLIAEISQLLDLIET